MARHDQQQPQTVWKQYDLNGDGKITPSEFMAVRAICFAKYDANGDGLLTRPEVKKFFRSHRTATKAEVFDLLIKIASKLGHKRYDKKEHEWVESPKVTVNNYIRPEFVERLHRYYS